MVLKPSQVLLHEYGHQIGLGDTYSENGLQNPANQPQGSVMMNAMSDSLSADDTAGIIKAWSIIYKKEAIQCGTGYQEGTAAVNTFNNFFVGRPALRAPRRRRR